MSVSMLSPSEASLKNTVAIPSCLAAHAWCCSALHVAQGGVQRAVATGQGRGPSARKLTNFLAFFGHCVKFPLDLKCCAENSLECSGNRFREQGQMETQVEDGSSILKGGGGGQLCVDKPAARVSTGPRQRAAHHYWVGFGYSATPCNCIKASRYGTWHSRAGLPTFVSFRISTWLLRECSESMP